MDDSELAEHLARRKTMTYSLPVWVDVFLDRRKRGHEEKKSRVLENALRDYIEENHPEEFEELVPKDS